MDGARTDLLQQNPAFASSLWLGLGNSSTLVKVRNNTFSLVMFRKDREFWYMLMQIRHGHLSVFRIHVDGSIFSILNSLAVVTLGWSRIKGPSVCRPE